MNYWVYTREGTTGWNWRIRFWRIQYTLTVLRHIYPRPKSPDRWVVQTSFVYDRKDRR